MKILTVGNDRSAVEQMQLAIRFRWPDATFMAAGTHQHAMSCIETDGVDLVALFPRKGDAPASDFCSELRQVSDVPLIVFADDSPDAEFEEARLLEAGADDYIRRSAELAETVARVVALIRRAQAQGWTTSGQLLAHGDLKIDPTTYQAFVKDASLELSATEFNLLHLLFRFKGAVVRHEMIERALWGDAVDSAGLVKKYVHRLRMKIAEKSRGDHEYIRSVYGVGYILSANSTAVSPGEGAAA